MHHIGTSVHKFYQYFQIVPSLKFYWGSPGFLAVLEYLKNETNYRPNFINSVIKTALWFYKNEAGPHWIPHWMNMKFLWWWNIQSQAYTSSFSSESCLSSWLSKERRSNWKVKSMGAVSEAAWCMEVRHGQWRRGIKCRINQCWRG